MISVLITNYNYGIFLHDAVSSVLQQDFADFELIFVDDGSTDDSIRIVREIRDPRLKVLEMQHRGQLASFSAGLSAAKGDIICFLDADDMYPAGYLQSVHDFYSDVLDCDFLFVGKSYFGRRNGYEGMRCGIERFGAHPFSAAMIHLWIGASTSACSIRRKRLEAILPLPDCEAEWKIRADDIILWGADIIGCIKYYSSQTYILYRVHASNHFFSMPGPARKEERKRRASAAKACLTIREKNGRTISALFREELRLGRYPLRFTLRAFVNFIRQWRTEKHFFREFFRCIAAFPVLLHRERPPIAENVRTALHLR